VRSKKIARVLSGPFASSVLAHAPHALDPTVPAAYKFIKVKVLGKTDGATLSDS
jgi:hypothetical protein